MKRRDDDALQDLFDKAPRAIEVSSVERPPDDPPVTIAPPDFAALRDLIEFHEDEAVIEAERLGAWAGFTRGRNASRTVRRQLAEFEALGLLQVGANSTSRGGRPTDRLLLNRECVNHFLNHCGLPHLRGFRLQVTRVFTEYQKHNLVSTNAETTEKLQDAATEAEDGAAGISLLFAWSRKIQETAERGARASEALVKNQRRDPTADTVRTATAVIKYHYRDCCPCCQRVKICPKTDGTHWMPNMAESEWAHMKGRYRREVFDGWFVCQQCNDDYEDTNKTIEIYQAFISYVLHVKAYLIHLELPF